MNTNPMVSVVMISYGHEKYIAEAIRGVFMQKTSFPVELLIANDCSPDNSDQIIRETIQSAPENITVRYTRHEKNLGMMPNFIWALEQAQGKYIALCEGDDYWIAENKLQMQVDFLVNNSDISLLFHDSEIVYEGTSENFSYHIPESRYYTENELLTQWLVPTASVIFRKKDVYFAIEKLKNPNYYFGDIVLFLSLLKRGKLYGMNKKMSTYRINPNGASKIDDTNRKYSRIILHLETLSKDFDFQYKDHFRSRIKNLSKMLSFYNLKNGNLVLFFKYFLKLFNLFYL
ncbi:glycosyltransferase [Chryseobacterium taklimakanense]|uniref:glycosyltransferase family 2 protein n=1 Tax=Chryseobacterium taklimakanense TaxID=536441 RepID=UPI001EF65FB2|nr:glycosyltransferase [Chryseobacterium taklimakanense]MCG7281468.1 glycosyltransferase [Chryseobacterium taklimakanense]